MEFTRTIKDKQVTKHQDDLMKIAEDRVYLTDFNSNLYIAVDGLPLLPIGEDWLPQDIVKELSKIRQNYVDSMMKNYKPGFLESLFKVSC